MSASDSAEVDTARKEPEAASNEEPNALEKKLIRQVEYYFGDHNLVKDKFLQDLVGIHFENWVSLETMITFKRLAALSTDFGVIATALKKSKNGVVEVSEDKLSIRRSPQHPVPELTTDRREEMRTRTVYVKGFPKNIELDQLQDFFDKHGEIVHIYMRRDAEKAFKGSVFVGFADASVAQKFLEAEDVQYEGEDLKRMMKKDYFLSKMDEFKKKKEAIKIEKLEKNRQEKEKDKIKSETQKEEKDPFEPGAVLHFEGVGEGIMREDLKAKFGTEEEVSFVNFNKGDTSGHIRFKGEGSAKRVLAGFLGEDGKLELNGVETKLKVLEGDEEKEYWKEVKAAQLRNQLRSQGGRRGKRRAPGRFQGSQKKKAKQTEV